MEIQLTQNEIKVLHQITENTDAVDALLVDMEYVASKIALTFEEVEEAMKGLHYNQAGILKTMDKKGDYIYVILTPRSYEISRLFK